jgi:amino acid transporter
MDSIGIHRPRNVDWKRAAGLLYGDWGTSKAYVIGLAFAAAGFSSLPIILAVCALTALVGYNYVVICRHFPDGGGVYSAARDQSRLLAVTGALLLVANFTVTAALSAWFAMSYFGIPKEYIAQSTIAIILVIGAINYFGPKHTGSLAVSLAVPMVLVVIFIAALSLPHLTVKYLEPSQQSFAGNWRAFIDVILALSGVEAIANLTGVMKLDLGATMDKPAVSKTARWAIWPVATEVVLGTSLLGWAMLSLPHSWTPTLEQSRDFMVRFLGEYYWARTIGPGFDHAFGLVVGFVIGLLLLSAVNTAISALIGLLYLMARDGEMPRPFRRLNKHGVPWFPMGIALALPVLVVIIFGESQTLAGLYAIGVVGAITVNLGACSFNKKLAMRWWERAVMRSTFLVLLAVEFTIARNKHDALFFALCILIFGLSLRAYAQRRAGLTTLTVTQQVAATLVPEAVADLRINLGPDQSILVAARGITPVLRFALEEARLRQATLYVLYVREIAVALPAPLPMAEPPRWQNNRQAAEIMYSMLEQGRQNQVSIIPLYAVSENPAATILDLAATLGIDILMLGASQRRRLVNILKGNVVTEVARNLPENIQLIIHG